MPTAPAARRRFSPEERTTQLLDCAQALVEDQGVAACTVAAVAERAGVTVQLVHRYLGKRPALLQALYGREEQQFTRQLRAALEQAESFEAVVRVFVTANFDQLSDRTAIGRLRGVPEVADLAGAGAQRDQRAARKLLVRRFGEAFAVPPATVELALRLGSAASIAAGSLSSHRPGRRAQDIEDTIRFIMAGIRAVAGSA